MLNECRRIWREVFRDSEEDISSFVDNHYRAENHLFIEVDGRHVSMVHLLPFNSEIGRVGYLYALATDEQYRGRGYGRELTMRAIELSRERGFNALFLIPAEESLRCYYAAMGFKPSAHLIFSTPDRYDFGTGDISKDHSMVYPLSSLDERALETSLPILLSLV
ncbi:MAG: GNAT family N-acetyltransferase [Rikenellaceae bacterium]